MNSDAQDEKTRRSIRLQGWDYRTAGAYFVTLVTYNRVPLFGTIKDGVMQLSPYGESVALEWVRSAEIRREIALDTFIVMPNHLHGIVWMGEAASAPASSPTPALPAGPRPLPQSLGAFIGGFKAAATRRVNEQRGTPGATLWQRNYYERVIRNERELDAIRVYIEGNPAQWADDSENPGRLQVG